MSRSRMSLCGYEFGACSPAAETRRVTLDDVRGRRTNLERSDVASGPHNFCNTAIGVGCPLLVDDRSSVLGWGSVRYEVMSAGKQL